MAVPNQGFTRNKISESRATFQIKRNRFFYQHSGARDSEFPYSITPKFEGETGWTREVIAFPIGGNAGSVLILPETSDGHLAFCADQLAVAPAPDGIVTNKTAPRILHHTIIREER